MAKTAPPTISFAGLVGIDSARYTMSRGVQASAGILTTPVTTQVPASISDFVATYEGTTLTLTDCLVSDCFVDSTESGETLRITFEDRRWRWPFTEIVGRYNVRQNKNTILYEKTPQQLATLLLDAMGETLYDVSALPNLTRPYMDWRNSRCDVELNFLLSSLDCDIVPDLSTGGLIVVKLGTGATLPTGPYLMNPSAAIGYATGPEQVRVITANARYQCLFECEAVGIEADGSIVPVASLSYIPLDGWELEDPEDFDGVEGTYTEDGVTREYRDLALMSVDRWFRIKRVVHDGYDYVYDPGGPDETTFGPGAAELNPPGFEEAQFSGAPDLTAVEQLLPLLPDLNDTFTHPVIGEKQRQMRLYGTWYDDTYESDHDNWPPGTMWQEGFDVDLERGIVKLPRPVRYLNTTTDEEEPAIFYLYAVCEVDWVGLNTKVYYGEYQNRIGVVTPTTTLTETRLDVIPTYNARYIKDIDDLPTVDSLEIDTEVYDQLGYYLDQLASRLIANEGATAEYAGLMLLNPDGAIEQVQWEFGPQGTTTRVSRFTRLNSFARSYQEIREDVERERASELIRNLSTKEDTQRTIWVRI